MKQKRFWGFVPVVCLLALPTLAPAQDSLSLGDAILEFNQEGSVALTLNSNQQIQGFVAVGEIQAADPAAAPIILDVARNEASLGADGDGPGADTVVINFTDSFFVMGVVLDSDPTDNDGNPEIISPEGEDVDVASITVLCHAGDDSGGVESSSDFVLVDGVHAAAPGGPPLDNVIVVGGLSIGETDGLALGDGTIRCIPAPDKFLIPAQDINVAGGQIAVQMNNNNEVEGFVTVVCHNVDALTLVGISLGADAAQADFATAEIEVEGGAFGVVIDLIDPMENPPNILPGAGHEIALYEYTTSLMAGESTPLRFCDNDIGTPMKRNLIVVGGLSVTSDEGLFLEGGDVTAAGDCDTRETNCSDGLDNDCDGFFDLEDIDCQTFDFDWAERDIPATPDGSPACLIYTAPTEASLGLAGDGGDVLNDGSPNVSTQGFSLAFSFECGVVTAKETFDVEGTILETLGAEFIGVQADNTDEDGDGCSVVLAVLVDALPPFDGAVIPGLAESQALGCLTFCASEEMACGTSTGVVPADGENGRGKVPVRNLISVDNLPFPVTVATLNITAVERARFYRGDCNFTGRTLGLDPVEIADAAAVISHLFQKSIFKFDPPCEDACDANDDGRIDLADAIGILNYLFVPGSRFPPAPGPGFVMNMDTGGVDETGPGVDETPDPLGCIGGSACEFR